MIIHGRTFSAVLQGRIEIFALSNPHQISIQAAGGNSIIAENQVLDCYPIEKRQEVK